MASSSTSQTHPPVRKLPDPPHANFEANFGPLSPAEGIKAETFPSGKSFAAVVDIKIGTFPPGTSFATAASKLRLQPRFRPVELPSHQYSSVDGKPSVQFTTVEFDVGAALFRHSLVAKFTMGRPSIEEIRNTFKANWPIKGRATVSDIWDARHLMIILDSEEDATSVLTSPLHKVDLDERTKACSTLKYARACVEIDVSNPIPDEVRIILSDGRIFWQKLELEGNLSYCSHCKIDGHILAACRKNRHTSKGIPEDHVNTIITTSAKETGPVGTSMQTKEAEKVWVEVRRKKGSKAANSKNKEPHTENKASPEAQTISAQVIQDEQEEGEMALVLVKVTRIILPRKGRKRPCWFTLNRGVAAKAA
ncbi:hypothetical protein QQ045_012087 [Rhodiola kirilowii]